MVPFLWPRIREKQIDCIQAMIGDIVGQDVNGIGAIDTDIAQPERLESQEQMAYAGTVHLDPQVVGIGIGGGHLGQDFAIAEADLDHDRRGATEHSAGVERLVAWKAVAGPERLERLPLRRCQAALT